MPRDSQNPGLFLMIQKLDGGFGVRIRNILNLGFPYKVLLIQLMEKVIWDD